jgi:hypothetical protein
MAKLRATKSLLPSLVVPIPPGLEQRILAAAEAAAPKKKQEAKVFRLFAGPQLAVAATVVLVAGAAVLFGGMNMMKAKSETASTERAAAPAASAVAAAEPAPPPLATATTAAPASDLQLVTAKSDFERGKLKEACPKFDELAANDPEAELYADKCLQRSKGCMAAVPKFEATAQKNAGTETGSRAALEAARCYRAMNDARATTRFAALQNDPYVGNEANAEAAPAQMAARKAAAPPPAATAAAGAAASPAKARPAVKAAKPASAADTLE